MTWLRRCSLLTRYSVLVLACGIFWVGSGWLPATVAMAQGAPAGAPMEGGPGGPGGERGPQPPPKNLKVLPKDTSRADVIKLMHQFEGELGVECEFCHAQNPATKRNDFASDANPMKDTARFMISMTEDLNTNYLDALPGRRYADPITCGTCHRGASHPTVFVPKPAPPRGGPPGAGPGAAPGAGAGAAAAAPQP